MRIDFHVHSNFSKRPSQWILQKIGCPESFTDPQQLYQIAKYRGMTHVTITDHNVIDGALEIAHLPNTFVSEEITTYFPDDRCKVHVLALNISESQHEEIQKIRENLFDLLLYLNQEDILHIAAHPLYSVNGRLTANHFEKMLLLFQNFELNGARNDRENQCIASVLEMIDEDDIMRLANKYDIAPLGKEPWKKRLFGGSDDHSSINITRSHTEIIGTENLDMFFADPSCFNTKVHIQPATPQTMAHNLYGIAFQFYRNKFGLDRYTDKDLLVRFLDSSLRIDLRKVKESSMIMKKLYFLWNYRKNKQDKEKASASLPALIQLETTKLIKDNPQLFPDVDDKVDDYVTREKKWFDFVNNVSNRVTLHFADHLMDHLSGANVFNLFHTVGSAGGLYTLLAPYFVAFNNFSKDRSLSEAISRRFLHQNTGDTKEEQKVKIAHFTDTFYEVNGVALTLQQHVKMAIKNSKQLTVITCSESFEKTQQGIQNFAPIGIYELPEYEEQKIFYPPLLEMLSYCYENQFNQIHTATPGPIGLAALAIARILKLPISGTYHTSIPQYAQILTGDESIEEVSWRYILWYYDQMDTIYAPSQSTKDELVEKGLSENKIKVYPRGIDIKKFTPEKRNGFFAERMKNPDHVKKILYVGRVSKEKNLHLLAKAFKKLTKTYDNIHLVIVGGGPYLTEMKKTMEGLPCLFTGYLKGEDLTGIYASSDVFVFPSTTDTFGNVVLEAQASGVPVIVTDKGGPCENMLPNKTGLLVPGDSERALRKALCILLDNRNLAHQMSQAARQYMEERSFEAAFIKSWQLYKEHNESYLLKKVS